MIVQTNELLSVVRALLEQPTAPFHEAAVRDAIIQCEYVSLEITRTWVASA